MKNGQTMPPEQRAKIAAALQGNSNGAGNLGKLRTAEARAKMSAAARLRDPASRTRTRTPREPMPHSGGRSGGHGRSRNPGQDVSYTAVHKRLRKDRGTPSLCEHCGTTEAKKFEWAFAGEGHELGAFSADLDKYIRLCTSCHLKFDGQHVRSWSTRKEVNV